MGAYHRCACSYAVSKNADCGNKVVWKCEPEEKVGVIGKRKGKFAVIEYSEMSKQDKALTDANGKLVYGAGHICNHFFSVDFLEQVSDKDLIFHVGSCPCLLCSCGRSSQVMKLLLA